MPPRIATAKALMPNSVPMVDEIVNSGAIRMPATPAKKPDIAKAADTATPTLIPMSRAAASFWTTASMARPCRVRLENSVKATASPMPTSGISTCCG